MVLIQDTFHGDIEFELFIKMNSYVLTSGARTLTQMNVMLNC